MSYQRRSIAHPRTSGKRASLRVEKLEQRQLLAADGIADAIFINGEIYSVDPNTAWETSAAEAIAIDDDQILAVGTNSEILLLVADDTNVLDLAGRMVLPGFHDVHTHIIESLSQVSTVQLAADTPLRDLLPSLSNQQPHPATGWVLGRGQSIDQFANLTELPKDILDEAIADSPAAFLDATSNSIWVNSAALAAAGITDSTPNPAGGIIQRDGQTGAATGLLIDSAVDLILDVALAQNAQLDEVNYQALLAGVDLFNQAGVTSVADARTSTSRGHDVVWQRAESEDALTIRANLGLWASPQRDDAEQIADLAARFNDNPDGLVKINEIKIYSDGVTENGTAAFIDPYNTDSFGGPNGLRYFEPDRLESYVIQLEQAGFTFNIHAVGDAGVRDALTAIENASQVNTDITDRRHRITNAESVHPDDYARFAASGVIADFQIGSEILEPANRESLRELIGDRADSILPVRSLHDAGATIVFSSDFDANELNPLVGIERSLTRDDGQNLPGVKEAIEAYTINAAMALGHDDRVGSLVAGKLADLIVLDQNLFDIDVLDIDTSTVVLTMLAGENVHGEIIQLSLADPAIGENGGRTSATVTRTGTTGDLVVQLSSTDTSEATVPATVTIADGATSATFDITAVDDLLDDDTQRVTIRAASSGSIDSLAFLGVVDDDPNGLDFGDAPTAAQSGFENDYPVTVAQNGATHIVSELRLGQLIDSEPLGQPSVQALGDDGENEDDEDGVALDTTLIVESDTAVISSFTITSSGEGIVDAWIDFNQNGNWTDDGEQILNSVDVLAGDNTFSVVLPAGSLPGNTAARVRLSTAGGLDPDGAAVDGEVEDEWLTILSGSQTVNAKVTTSFNTTSDSPIVIATLDGRTSIADAEKAFFETAASSFGGLSVAGARQDETFVIDVNNFSVPSRGLTLNGGAGDNRLNLTGDATVSLIDNSIRLASLNVIDLSGSGGITLVVDSAAVQSLSSSREIRIISGDGDRLEIADGENWRFVAPVIEDGQLIRRIQNVVSGQEETIQINSTLHWHNDLLPYDVDNSGVVTPNDILEVINQLVSRDFIQPNSQTPLSATDVNPWPNRFYDTSADNLFTPNDILGVINFLVEQRTNQPQGEFIGQENIASGISDFTQSRRATNAGESLTSDSQTGSPTNTGANQRVGTTTDSLLVIDSVFANFGDLLLGPTSLGEHTSEVNSTETDAPTLSHPIDDMLSSNLAAAQLDTSLN